MSESQWWGGVVACVVAAACRSDGELVGRLQEPRPVVTDTEAPEAPEPLPPPPDPEVTTTPPPVEVATQTDVLVQLAPPQVDVLWVIDNSCSMDGEQLALTDNFPKFMDYFLGSGLDYHVGVTSTDMDDPDHSGRLQAGGTSYSFIDTDTIDAFGVFTAMATLGTTGAANERGLDATYAALDTLAYTDNAGFQRDDAAVHTIVLSDESDYDAPDSIPDADVITWYGAIKADPAERTFSSIVNLTLGVAYVGVTDAIGGITWDIQDQTWDQALDALGIQASGLEREYFLSQVPVLGTIEVTVEEPTGGIFVFDEAIGVPLVGDWTYDSARNSVSFLVYAPPPLARIILHYDVSPLRDLTRI